MEAVEKIGYVYKDEHIWRAIQEGFFNLGIEIGKEELGISLVGGIGGFRRRWLELGTLNNKLMIDVLVVGALKEILIR